MRVFFQNAVSVAKLNRGSALRMAQHEAEPVKSRVKSLQISGLLLWNLVLITIAGI